MITRKKLVLFVEGIGDKAAVPVLLKRLLTDLNAWQYLSLDLPALTVGNVADVTREDCKDWVRWLESTRKRPQLGGVLLLLDGDVKTVRKEPFCARDFAIRLAQRARAAGAGSVFSVATVFACQEYESWILAGVDHLAGLPLADGRPGIAAGASAPQGDLERTLRNAKGRLDQLMASGYKESRDQELLTQLLVHHLDAIRERQMRSFRRLENAVRQLVEAIRSGEHIVSPVVPPPPQR